MTAILDTFTSTGSKLFFHQEAMRSLRAGRGRVIVCHAMITDTCNHKCSFCSVADREGNSLKFHEITGFVDILLKYGLRAIILSGGGNPILYKCKDTGKNFNDVVDALHARGLEIGLITNGMPLREFIHAKEDGTRNLRESWGTVRPETLDKLTWIRISMSGLDHDENEVYVPDVDPAKTTLGMSYVAADSFEEPLHKAHGRVSRPEDFVTLDRTGLKEWKFDDRIDTLIDQFTHYCKIYRPKYLRLLPNCNEVSKIKPRCQQLEKMCRIVNAEVGADVAFVQYKPPQAPKACYLGYVHPVLNSDGYVLPCDSCCLNESAGHKLGEAWRICHWSEIGKIYEEPVRSLINDPAKMCPGCVFPTSNAILSTVIDGTADITPPTETPGHVNFV